MELYQRLWLLAYLVLFTSQFYGEVTKPLAWGPFLSHEHPLSGPLLNFNNILFWPCLIFFLTSGGYSTDGGKGCVIKGRSLWLRLLDNWQPDGVGHRSGWHNRNDHIQPLRCSLLTQRRPGGFCVPMFSSKPGSSSAERRTVLFRLCTAI